jgi:hypothetical protein
MSRSKSDSFLSLCFINNNTRPWACLELDPHMSKHVGTSSCSDLKQHNLSVAGGEFYLVHSKNYSVDLTYRLHSWIWWLISDYFCEQSSTIMMASWCSIWLSRCTSIVDFFVQCLVLMHSQIFIMSLLGGRWWEEDKAQVSAGHSPAAGVCWFQGRCEWTGIWGEIKGGGLRG